MTLKELMDKASPVPWSEDPEGIVQVEIESAEGLPVGCAYLPENQVDANSPNAELRKAMQVAGQAGRLLCTEDIKDAEFKLDDALARAAIIHDGGQGK